MHFGNVLFLGHDYPEDNVYDSSWKCRAKNGDCKIQDTHHGNIPAKIVG